MCSGHKSEPPEPAATVDDIADALVSERRFTVRIDPLPHQRLVDLHWAAHNAGQRLGIKVRVVARGPVKDDPLVTITVTPRPSNCS